MKRYINEIIPGILHGKCSARGPRKVSEAAAAGASQTSTVYYCCSSNSADLGPAAGWLASWRCHNGRVSAERLLIRPRRGKLRMCACAVAAQAEYLSARSAGGQRCSDCVAFVSIALVPGWMERVATVLKRTRLSSCAERCCAS